MGSAISSQAAPAGLGEHRGAPTVQKNSAVIERMRVWRGAPLDRASPRTRRTRRRRRGRRGNRLELAGRRAVPRPMTTKPARVTRGVRAAPAVMPNSATGVASSGRTRLGGSHSSGNCPLSGRCGRINALALGLTLNRCDLVDVRHQSSRRRSGETASRIVFPGDGRNLLRSRLDLNQSGTRGQL